MQTFTKNRNHWMQTWSRFLLKIASSFVYCFVQLRTTNTEIFKTLQKQPVTNVLSNLLKDSHQILPFCSFKLSFANCSVSSYLQFSFYTFRLYIDYQLMFQRHHFLHMKICSKFTKNEKFQPSFPAGELFDGESFFYIIWVIILKYRL